MLRAGEGDSHNTVKNRTFVLYAAHFPRYQEKDQLRKLQTSLPAGTPSRSLRSRRGAAKCIWRATIYLVDNSRLFLCPSWLDFKTRNSLATHEAGPARHNRCMDSYKDASPPRIHQNFSFIHCITSLSVFSHCL